MPATTGQPAGRPSSAAGRSSNRPRTAPEATTGGSRSVRIPDAATSAGSARSWPTSRVSAARPVIRQAIASQALRYQRTSPRADGS